MRRKRYVLSFVVSLGFDEDDDNDGFLLDFDFDDDGNKNYSRI